MPEKARRTIKTIRATMMTRRNLVKMLELVVFFWAGRLLLGPAPLSLGDKGEGFGALGPWALAPWVLEGILVSTGIAVHPDFSGLHEGS